MSRFCKTEYISSGSARTTGSRPTLRVAPACSSSRAASSASWFATVSRSTSTRIRPTATGATVMFWSSIRSIRSAALVVRSSRAATAGSGRSPSSSWSISKPAMIELSGTRRSWLSSAASCDILHGCIVWGMGVCLGRGCGRSRSRGIDAGPPWRITDDPPAHEERCHRDTEVARASGVWRGESSTFYAHRFDAAILRPDRILLETGPLQTCRKPVR